MRVLPREEKRKRLRKRRVMTVINTDHVWESLGWGWSWNHEEHGVFYLATTSDPEGIHSILLGPLIHPSSQWKLYLWLNHLLTPKHTPKFMKKCTFSGTFLSASLSSSSISASIWQNLPWALFSSWTPSLQCSIQNSWWLTAKLFPSQTNYCFSRCLMNISTWP